MQKLSAILNHAAIKFTSQKAKHTALSVLSAKDEPLDTRALEIMSGVEQVVDTSDPYKLANRAYHPLDTIVSMRGVQVGGKQVQMIAGPCSVESREQILETAHAVKEAGAVALRGGAFKPRTSPYSFQGHGEQGLQWLAEAREATGSAHRNRNYGPGACAAGHRIRGCLAGGRTQYAKFHAAECSRKKSVPGTAQTGYVCDD